jgi:galactose mutarotase-like enzyme
MSHYSIQNECLKINVNQIGAELCSIIRLSDNKEFMWDGNPAIWQGFSPVLFPIVGALKGDKYYFQNREYSLPRHGFARNSSNFEVSELTANSLTLRLVSDENTLKMYPFYFEFYVRYVLNGNSIQIEFEVKNTDLKDMFFSLGAHPAFKCPHEKHENYNDYYLEFDQNETQYTHKIEPDGLIGEKSDLVMDNSKTINLHYTLFDKGAMVFKTLKSRKVSLVSKLSGKRVLVDFRDFPYIGIWAKPNADYVCIEPWLGIGDNVGTDQNIETKEGILKLEQNRSFKAAYSIQVF